MLTIRGIPVSFPHESPYPVQIEYMNKVMDCLSNGSLGLLESPTGTGKTLCLLCASLAWLKNFSLVIMSPDEVKVSTPKIIYASRTHSQLTQVISEFSCTEYAKIFTSSILGSREQLCIHKDVLGSSIDKNILCRSKIRSNECSYYSNYEKNMESLLIDKLANSNIDELKSIGMTRNVCPYYFSRKKSESAHIIFMPYNYLFDSKIRKTLSVDLEGSIVILDEAHNVLRNCEESNSLSFEAKDIAIAISECDQMIGLIEKEEFSENAEVSVPDLLLLKEILISFESLLLELLPNDYSGDKLLRLLMESGLTSSNVTLIKSQLDKITDFFTTLAVNSPSFSVKGKGISTIDSIISLVFSDLHSTDRSNELLHTYFKLYVEKSEKNTKNLLFHLWCFSPGFCMTSLLQTGLRSLILTSGTLSPLSSFQNEMNTTFQITLSNEHVIESRQIFVRVLPSGLDKYPLSSSYQTRSDPKYLNSLGVTLLRIFRSVPNGVLVFFPSYSVMNSSIEYWQIKSGLWKTLLGAKSIYIEPRGKGDLNSVVNEYRRKIASNGGAVLMAVCRGKVAEGIDFADKDARAVIITGIPFPNVKDARISLKRKYLDFQKTIKADNITGNDWYNLEAYRAINQAIGRVIRHKNDFGAIIFLDKRFVNVKSHLSQWIQPRFQIENDFKVFMEDMKVFFGEECSRYSDVLLTEKSSGSTSSKRNVKTLDETSLPQIKRKKIVIVQSRETNAISATSFVQELKDKLNKDELLFFKKCVKDYRASNDFSSIAQLLQSNWFSEKFGLLERQHFKIFIKETHKDLYMKEPCLYSICCCCDV